MRGLSCLCLSAVLGAALPALAQEGQAASPAAAAAAPVAAAPAPITGAPAPADAVNGTNLPPEYTIGVGDVLSVVFWRERDLSSDVTVRPDGRITLPLINDIYVSGLTPTELRSQLTGLASRFVTDPTPSVIVRQVNSRNVFITGQVVKPGAYPIYGPTRVLQLIAAAGGLREFAHSSDIVIVRNTDGHQTSQEFNYKDVTKQRNLAQNIELEPGDTVVVP
jgi:polysaccharide export outer membrane protein